LANEHSLAAHADQGPGLELAVLEIAFLVRREPNTGALCDARRELLRCVQAEKLHWLQLRVWADGPLSRDEMVRLPDRDANCGTYVSLPSALRRSSNVGGA